MKNFFIYLKWFIYMLAVCLVWSIFDAETRWIGIISAVVIAVMTTCTVIYERR